MNLLHTVWQFVQTTITNAAEFTLTPIGLAICALGAVTTALIDRVLERLDTTDQRIEQLRRGESDGTKVGDLIAALVNDARS